MGARLLSPEQSEDELRYTYEVLWKWKLKEKLTEANEVIRQIYAEAVGFNGVRKEVYEAFMSRELQGLLKEICDVPRKRGE